MAEEAENKKIGKRYLPKLMAHIYLNKYRGWSLRKLKDAEGNRRVHMCIPCDLNGIILMDKNKKVLNTEMDDVAEVTQILQQFQLSGAKDDDPRTHEKRLYHIIPVIYVGAYHRLVDEGVIQKGEAAPICGGVMPWPFGRKKKKE